MLCIYRRAGEELDERLQLDESLRWILQSNPESGGSNGRGEGLLLR